MNNVEITIIFSKQVMLPFLLYNQVTNIKTTGNCTFPDQVSSVIPMCYSNAIPHYQCDGFCFIQMFPKLFQIALDDFDSISRSSLTLNQRKPHSFIVGWGPKTLKPKKRGTESERKKKKHHPHNEIQVTK